MVQRVRRRVIGTQVSLCGVVRGVVRNGRPGDHIRQHPRSVHFERVHFGYVGLFLTFNAGQMSDGKDAASGPLTPVGYLPAHRQPCRVLRGGAVLILRNDRPGDGPLDIVILDVVGFFIAFVALEI